MNNIEKMQNQKLYDADKDSQLVADRLKCKDLCHEYNQLRPSQTSLQDQIIKKILGEIKEPFHITAPFWCDYGYNIAIGENFYANHNLIILDGGKVKIGDNVFIAPDCGIYTAGHPVDKELRNSGLEYAYPVTIGDDVWIGGGVKIMPGVSIGSNVVIGSGSVITRDVPDSVVAAGNPCRILRFLTNKDKHTKKL